MAFARRIIGKTLDLLNLQRHNDNYADIENNLTNHESRLTGAQSDITTHKASNAAHPAEHVTYSGAIVGATNIKEGLDSVKDTLDNVIVEGGDGTQAAAAAVSVSGTTYITLKQRVDTEYLETDEKFTTVSAQLAETAVVTKESTGIKNTLNKFISGEVTNACCVGDSLTWGTKQIPSTAQVANPYPALLQSALRKIYKNNNITITNKGQPGASTQTFTYSDALEFRVNVLANNPDMIILMLGYNDMANGFTVKQYTENLSIIIDLTLKAGIDLVLMSPPYTLRKEYGGVWYVNEKLKQLSDAVQYLAGATNTMFIDVQNEMIDMFYKYNTYKLDEIFGMDCIHLIDYSIITNIVIRNLQGNIALNVVEETIQPIVGNLYVETNTPHVGYISSVGGSNFNWVYGGLNAKTSTLYYKLRLNVLKKNMSLCLFFGSSKAHGNIVIKDNGVTSKTLNMSIDDTTYNDILFGTKATIVDNLTIGYHEILISSDNIVESGKYMVLEGFSLEEPKKRVICEDIEANAVNGATLVKKLGDYTWERKIGVKSVLKVVGMFANGTGFKPLMLNNFNAPFVLNFSTSKLYLSECDLNGNFSITTAGTTTIDLTKKHEFRLEFLTQNVKVYIDDVLELDHTLTLTKMYSGNVGLWSNGSTDGRIYLDKVMCSYIE